MHHCAFPWEGWERLSKYIDTNDWKRFILPLVISACKCTKKCANHQNNPCFFASFSTLLVRRRPIPTSLSLSSEGWGKEAKVPVRTRKTDQTSFPYH